MPTRRRLLIGAALAARVEAAGFVDVWIELSEPALSTLPPGPQPGRAELDERIRRQQDAVAAQLRELGGRELGRIKSLRNAVAFALPEDQLDAARRLPGVVALRRAQDVPRNGRDNGATTLPTAEGHAR